MTKEEIILKVKVALRSSTSDADLVAEIGDCVSECIEDLIRAGAPTKLDGTMNYDDPLVLKACKLYAKSEYGYDADSEKFRNCYEQVKQQLCMYSAYKVTA